MQDVLISLSTPRRLLIAATSLALAAASLTAVSTPASAADPTDLYVVGTSDVSDSGLITPTSDLTVAFEKEYPYNLLYTGTGTGNAITTAEQGGAAALVVHAPSLENQFVAANYSEGLGDALFWGDYVLLGPASDPAGVMANGSTNPIAAFQDIATAGAKGKAQFVSRGSNPGTTVAEHQIWKQTQGVNTCVIDDADGGGTAPTTSAAGSQCTPTTQNPPSWYDINSGAKQAANIEAANACTFHSGESNDCYVLTDRGTYENLVNQGAPATPSNLTILTKNDDKTAKTATGQLLVNTFHGYVVNPSSVPANSKTDPVGAADFLNFVTSPEGQAIVGKYLSTVDNQKSNPPFLPDAAPKPTLGSLPAQVDGGKALTVSGTLTNVVPGTPTLSGVKVQLLATPTTAPKATPQQVATAVTNASGGFTLKSTPTRNMIYSLATPSITKVEYPDLDPIFSDVLQASTTPLSTVDVKGTVTDVTGKGGKGSLDVKATTLPSHTGSTSTLTLYARKAGSTKAFTKYGTKALKAGATAVHQTYALPKGKYRFYLRYSNPGVIADGGSPSQGATVS